MRLRRFVAWGVRRRGWLLRAALLVVLSTWAAAPRPLVAIGPVQSVVTHHPILCVHTRLTDEVEPWKIMRTLEMVRQMGAPTIVEYFPWAYHASAPGQYGWAHADMVVDFARSQGLAVIARLGGLVPAWARPQAAGTHTTETYLDAAHYADFGDYVYAFVSHFKGRITHVVIWNEPNVTLEWGFRPVDAAAYVQLLKVGYARAKEADPDVVVLAGALAPTLEPEGSELALDDLVYLQRMYDAGARGYFDALAVHAYGLKFPPDDPPAPEALNFRRVELARAVMVANGDEAKPIIVTESGWNDSPRWTKAVTPGTRIDYTLAGYAWAEQHWPWAAAVCTWAFRYPAPQRSYGDYFTLVSPGFEIKPIYEAVKAWATQ